MAESGLHPVDSLAAWTRPVAEARLVDASRADAFARMGVETIGDLVHHYPFRYLDLSATPRLGDLRMGQDVTVVGRVHEVKVKRPRPKLSVVEVAIVDGTGVVVGVWFNQSYIAKRFVEGEKVAFAGRVEMDYGLRQIKNPFVEKLGADDDPSEIGRILPVHPATQGLSSNWIRRLVACAVEDYGEVPDHLPVSLRQRRDLLSLSTALRKIHFPATVEDAAVARKRLAYDELLVLQLGMALKRHALTKATKGISHVIDGPALSNIGSALPFELTRDQRQATDEILADMAREESMNRLLLGDVGTGKTVVAAHALCCAIDSGGQAAMMAPTEVLASQYALKVGPILDELRIRWALLTGSTTAADRTEILDGLTTGDIGVVFGTHALLEAQVEFTNLSLAIVDEQHRFGVEQRIGLRAKGGAADMLVMTATPIPRTLALTVYGDLAVSYLRTRPQGDAGPRISTKVIDKRHRKDAYAAVRSAASAGHQAYVICPLVEESEAAQAKAAVDEVKRLDQEVFPELEVELMTGRMRPAEKAAVMDRFRAGEIDVLVSTTVVEVGVDVPNATTMIVEDAERFGLAQLHQLRGRVGRGETAGEVFLFADPKTPDGVSRMAAIESTEDGFELAELDLSLRGEGQLLGERQSGLPDLTLASLTEDQDLLRIARQDAQEMVDADPGLTANELAPLREEVLAKFGEAWRWVSSG